MGRLATHLAAAVANADNLSPANKLEQISFMDALLPRSCTDRSKEALLRKKHIPGSKHQQKLQPHRIQSRLMYRIRRAENVFPSAVAAGSDMLYPKIICAIDKRVRFEDPAADISPLQAFQQTPEQQWNRCFEKPQRCSVRCNHKGKKVFVAHKGRCYDNGPNADSGSKGGNEDVRKGANWNGKGKGKEDVKEDGKVNGGGGDGGGDDKKPHELTAEEDEKLKALKAGGKSWKDIAAEMGKSKGVLTQRWKIIDPNKADGDAAGKNERGEEDKNKDDGGRRKEDAKPAPDEKKMTKAEKKAARKEAVTKQDEPKTNDKKPKSNCDNRKTTTSASRSGSEARFTKDEWVTLQEDDLFSFGELQLLSELIAKYDTDRWQLVASRFFDKTGRRVHADDIRDKFLGVGAMG